MSESTTEGPLALVAMLQEIVESGGPAQRAYAVELMGRLRDGTDPAAVRPDVERLIDAYRHDPYLWR